jgi:CBS domain containing-hemolysin-like protein
VIGGLLLAVTLLLANGFFVAVEFSLVATRRQRLEQLAGEGDARAKAAIASVSDLSFMLSATQLGVTLASLGLGYIAEPTVAALIETPLELAGMPEGAIHPIALVLGLTIVVFFHTVIGEMVPKNVAIAEPDRTALWLALPMRAFALAFRPAILVLNVLTFFGLKLFGVTSPDEIVTIATGDELAGMLAASRKEGLLDEVEHRLMTGALGFPNREVSSVMVPRDQVVAVQAGTPIEEVERLAVQCGSSRMPVYGVDLDDVLGYVHVKDLLALPPDRGPMPSSVIRPIPRVPTDKNLQELLLRMRRERIHFAAVLVGDKTFAGIVTLEDVLESLVGDIRDEHD